MGQAKQRGTREQRIADAKERAYEEEKRREREKAARWSKMSPQERQAAMHLASMAAMFGGLK